MQTNKYEEYYIIIKYLNNTILNWDSNVKSMGFVCFLYYVRRWNEIWRHAIIEKDFKTHFKQETYYCITDQCFNSCEGKYMN